MLLYINPWLFENVPMKTPKSAPLINDWSPELWTLDHLLYFIISLEMNDRLQVWIKYTTTLLSNSPKVWKVRIFMLIIHNILNYTPYLKREKSVWKSLWGKWEADLIYEHSIGATNASFSLFNLQFGTIFQTHFDDLSINFILI